MLIVKSIAAFHSEKNNDVIRGINNINDNPISIFPVLKNIILKSDFVGRKII